jgi:mannonate dehydratase
MAEVTITGVRAIACCPDGSNLVVVRVDTNQPGLYGLGCATYTQRWKAVVTAVEEYMAPLLIGRDASRIEDIWQTAHGSSYWRNGPVLNNAISGCDMALWDILGKEAGLPVYRLLGGKCREGAAVYRHADGRDLVEVEDNVRRYIEKGYQYIRIQMGGYGGAAVVDPMSINDPSRSGRRAGERWLKSPEGRQPGAYFDALAYMRGTLALFEHIRGSVGDEVELLHDVHERLTPVDAIRLAKGLEPYRLFFLEDALAPEQVDWFRHIRSQAAVPLAMGELFNNPMEWSALIDERLIDFIRVHISQIGGLTPVRKLAMLCEAHGIRTAWHGPGDVSPVGHACNVHLDLASANFGIQEWCGIDESPRLNEVFSGIPRVRDGFVYVEDKPGFGVDIDEEKAKRYPCFSELPEWTLTRLPDGTAVKP